VTGVPFFDFDAHMAPVRSEIEAAIARVLASGFFILGPEGQAFEAELAQALGAQDAVGVANGTEALQLALEALGVGPGDEVVTSPLSAAFTALAVARTGARPVFADIDDETLTLSPERVEQALTPRTKALLPVHLYGHPAHLGPLLDIARRRGIPLVEDACQAHGARYEGRAVGSIGAAGALSFYPTKNLGALGDGGAVLLGDTALAPRLRQLRNGGQSDRYRHEISGINSRLDEIQAAVLRAKLPLLGAWTERRRAIAEAYRRELEDSGLRLPCERPWARAVRHLFVVRHPRRDAFMTALRERGIGTLIHYPIPLHLQPAFAALGGAPGDLPVAEKAAAEVVSLPLYPELRDDQVLEVAGAVKEVLRSLPV
jgi:dTDP-4-amino-4,6-dideoxygalactose transaminase